LFVLLRKPTPTTRKVCSDGGAVGYLLREDEQQKAMKT
jgi:hypothetical protein